MEEFAPPQKNITLYVTRATDCAYLPNQQSSLHISAPTEYINNPTYAHLLQQGFRRSGKSMYRPQCAACAACISLRIPVAHFRPNRSQRRCFKQYQELSVSIQSPLFSSEHYQLYQQYQRARHAGGDMDVDSPQAYCDLLLDTCAHTMLVEFRAQDVLKMVAIVDVLPHALSAIYTFYACEPRSAYGIYGVLWQIAYAQQHNLEHVYLGYWVENSTTMDYKKNFQPCEVLGEQGWQYLHLAKKSAS